MSPKVRTKTMSTSPTIARCTVTSWNAQPSSPAFANGGCLQKTECELSYGATCTSQHVTS